MSVSKLGVFDSQLNSPAGLPHWSVPSAMQLKEVFTILNKSKIKAVVHVNNVLKETI